MQNQMNQPNMQQSPNMSPTMNHGGHEIFDGHEILSSFINALDQYQLFDQHLQDQELKGILHRQYTFINDLYNVAVQSFSTGQDPSHPTQSYKMEQSNDVIYGLKPAQPKKPNQSVSEINEQGISGHMLGLIKSTGSMLGMAACEITNPVFRRVIADSVPNFVEMGYELFLYQNKHHYYQVPQLAPQDMTQMLNGFAPSQTGQQMQQGKNIVQ
ncbi:spore coat protein [Metabacillus herbersteinensis]|uniref:Spore coat protein n=1 Tax=Metabacillus herbersteinensis TaxID=283816 RepID=A0ABV6GLT1_9BACI